MPIKTLAVKEDAKWWLVLGQVSCLKAIPLRVKLVVLKTMALRNVERERK